MHCDTKNLMFKHKMMSQNKAIELDKAARTWLWKARLPQGKMFLPSYQINHAEQLSQRQAMQKIAREARKAKKHAVGIPEVSNLMSRQAGPITQDIVDIS